MKDEDLRYIVFPNHSFDTHCITYFREEMELYELLLKVSRSRDEHDPMKMTWQPFKGVNTTEVLKATTRDIGGVSMTVMDLRTAAESYIDQIDKPDIQRGLSYAEGHSERIAKKYYRRNGSTCLLYTSPSPRDRG